MLLALLVGLHVAAAFKHLLVDRDGVMARMLPFSTRKEF
jgi:cytochrome b561